MQFVEGIFTSILFRNFVDTLCYNCIYRRLNLIMDKLFYISSDKHHLLLKLNNSSCDKIGEISSIDSNVSNGAKEKHVPVIKIIKGEAIVKVGEISHPMEEHHHIEFIMLVTSKGDYIKYLNVGSPSETHFLLDEGEEVLEVFSYCNLHGLFSKTFKNY